MNPEADTYPPWRVGTGTKTFPPTVGDCPPLKIWGNLSLQQLRWSQVLPRLPRPRRRNFLHLQRRRSGTEYSVADILVYARKIPIQNISVSYAEPGGKNRPLAAGVNNPNTVLAMSRRSCKVYADFGLSPSILVRQLTILDTGAGSNFVCVDTLPLG